MTAVLSRIDQLLPAISAGNSYPRTQSMPCGTSRSTNSNYLLRLNLSEAVQTEALGIDDDDKRISMLTGGGPAPAAGHYRSRSAESAFQAVLNGTSSKPGSRSR